ncbi:uncharacterized protein LOC112682431 [Sipha flava]|uniref:Uncharacterized protein LOC112682431 n=1 Tax=Sipha flava TaxID=143950 RepID=A0A8B8FDJ3_9HEMI|nr:uncharacterized protein LOC112682431 [Sipha flava]
MAHTEIEELDVSEDDDQQCNEYIDFKNKLYHAKALLMQLIDANSNNPSSSLYYKLTISELTKYKTENIMRLPPVEIPKFDGDWQCWTSFIDSFNIVFHNHENLAPVQKFHYLKGYLVGQASDVIWSIPTTGENYLQAYNTLMNRYDNKSVIIQSHIRSLFDTPKALKPASPAYAFDILKSKKKLLSLQPPSIIRIGPYTTSKKLYEKTSL